MKLMVGSAEPTDGELIAAVLEGRRSAFELIALRYQRRLLNTAFSRLGRWDWAEEAVQETLLCALKFIASYNSLYSFRTWLWTILLNQCRRQLARHGRWSLVANWTDREPCDTSGSLVEQADGSEASPHRRTHQREQAELVAGLLQLLPEQQADALRLRFFGQLKFQEIADAMHCSLSTAKNRVRLGLTAISDLMRRNAIPGAASLLDRPELES